MVSDDVVINHLWRHNSTAKATKTGSRHYTWKIFDFPLNRSLLTGRCAACTHNVFFFFFVECSVWLSLFPGWWPYDSRSNPNYEWRNRQHSWSQREKRGQRWDYSSWLAPLLVSNIIKMEGTQRTLVRLPITITGKYLRFLVFSYYVVLMQKFVSNLP